MAIEYSSDVLIGLQYEGMDFTEGEKDKDREKRIRGLVKQNIDFAKRGLPQALQIKILKNRNGGKGDTAISFFPMFNYFEDVKKVADGGNWSKSEGSFGV